MPPRRIRPELGAVISMISPTCLDGRASTLDERSTKRAAPARETVKAKVWSRWSRQRRPMEEEEAGIDLASCSSVAGVFGELCLQIQ